MLDPGLGFQRAKNKGRKEVGVQRPGHLRLVRELDPILSKHDPDIVRRIYPWLSWLVDNYFRLEFRGSENLLDSACLIVSTHNGGIFTPDAYSLAVGFWRRFGLEAPAYGMAHKAVFHLPVFRSLMPRLGAVPANRESARIVLEAGFPAFVCPGGDLDALKPYRMRHQITFGNRTGFISAAIRHQAPIVPVVSVGAHEVMCFLNDGRRLAKISGFSRLFRIKTVPFALSFPFGITPAGLCSLPLPSKVVVRVLPRIELHESPARADDPDTVARCFKHVTTMMQGGLDDLAAERRFPVLG